MEKKKTICECSCHWCAVAIPRQHDKCNWDCKYPNPHPDFQKNSGRAGGIIQGCIHCQPNSGAGLQCNCTCHGQGHGRVGEFTTAPFSGSAGNNKDFQKKMDEEDIDEKICQQIDYLYQDHACENERHRKILIQYLHSRDKALLERVVKLIQDSIR